MFFVGGVCCHAELFAKCSLAVADAMVDGSGFWLFVPGNDYRLPVFLRTARLGTKCSFDTYTVNTAVFIVP